MLHKEFNNGLGAYPTHQAVQTIGSTALNEVINTVMILKDQLKHIWSYKSRTWAGKALDHWCALARALNHRALNKFAKMLERHRYGLLNHWNTLSTPVCWKG